MRDGATITPRYQLDLSRLQTGSRIGVVRCSDQTLHYYLNGIDQGVACTSVPAGWYINTKLLRRASQIFYVPYLVYLKTLFVGTDAVYAAKCQTIFRKDESQVYV